MLIFSGILAWITLLLFILLAIKWLIRLLAMRFDRFKKINRALSKTHKPLGILILFTALLHGLTSSALVFSFNLGTLSFILFILLALSYAFKRYYKPQFLVLHRILTVLTLVCIILHIVDVGGLNLINKIKQAIKKDPIEDVGDLNDGPYEGSGTGLKGKITVRIEIQDGKIQNIILLESSETKEYMDKAVKELQQQIISQNNANVDAVAGATYASNGYIEAVRNALSKAKKG